MKRLLKYLDHDVLGLMSCFCSCALCLIVLVIGFVFHEQLATNQQELMEAVAINRRIAKDVGRETIQAIENRGPVKPPTERKHGP